MSPADGSVAVAGLSFSYPDGTLALRDVSFRIEPGACVALIGANGAGKSTLLLHLNGSALPGPGLGTVTIGAREVGPGSLDAVRRTVGMVFQDPDDQLFMPTVREDVAFGPGNLGLDPAEVARRVDRALATVDLAQVAHKPPYHLSAGQKRRAAIATVLAMEPGILVMDEPTTGLDPRARRQLIELLKGFGHTRIIATHDLELVLELCERTIILHEGSVQADGPTRRLFEDPGLLAACHLERPPSLRPCPSCGANPMTDAY